ncbi:MAG TPA: hypothetical protein VD994_07620 [Prosthecobacter sp.]|nr:hypothetical protein [Prosthecobacter sp.]
MKAKKKYITVAMLKKLDACEGGIANFKRTFGARAAITVENVRIADGCYGMLHDLFAHLGGAGLGPSCCWYCKNQRTDGTVNYAQAKRQIARMLQKLS